MKEAFLSHLGADPILEPLLRRIELSLEEKEPTSVYDHLLRSIVYQQLSGKSASAIHKRFIELFPNGGPLPQQLLDIEESSLLACGLSRQKAAYLRNVASFFVENQLIDFDWSTLDDEAVIQRLTQIKGVGRWTVEMILMSALQRTDVLPLDDLGIQQAFQGLYQLTETGRNLKQRMVEIAEPWRPYRTYACLYLWRWKDGAV